ncbi:MAG TPA: hypothetical protein VFW79_07785 [Cellulomonas sp.]|uniref:hypothetical protein n=1 Tax=Cellulomonas sp. TaxID=40001 RepID=UPI002E3279D0|nr:hypothetical protein [Cellulomonas sp.]HEX5332526.1 hypothetical protein [Cellulomonas sp.]
MTPFERSVVFWLRAYPRRWRELRASEVTAVLSDVAGPGARRPDARTALDLVLAGWATRWREHPPPRLWWQYRVLRRRLPRPYRAWMRDDVEGFWFPLRMNLAVQMFMLPLLWGLHSPRPFDRWGLLGLGIWLALITVVLWRTARNAGRRLYLVRTNPPVPVTRSGDRTPRAAR